MFALLRKDLRCLLRAKDWLSAVFLFGLVLVVLASYAFRHTGYGQVELRELTPGVLWTIFFFCGVTSLNYGFVLERELGALEGLLLSPVDPVLVYLSKLITGFGFLFVLQCFVVVMFGALFGVELFEDLGPMLVISAFASFGFVALGTLLASIAACLPGRDIVLPLLLFPLSLPALTGAVYVTRDILAQGAIDYSGFWFLLVASFDVISFTLAVVLFEHAVREY